MSVEATVQPTEVVKDFLQNIAPGKLEGAAQRLVADNATYISLNFENPELKQILPYTGTASSPDCSVWFVHGSVGFDREQSAIAIGDSREGARRKDRVLPVLRGHVCDRAQLQSERYMDHQDGSERRRVRGVACRIASKVRWPCCTKLSNVRHPRSMSVF
jgi:hypothetical protein